MSKKANEELSVFDQIQEGLENSIAYSKGELSLVTTELPAPPPKATKKQISQIRRKLRMSQAVFASVLNVSVKTVQSWEQGVREPSDAALRLLQLVSQNTWLVWRSLADPPEPRKALETRKECAAKLTKNIRTLDDVFKERCGKAKQSQRRLCLLLLREVFSVMLREHATALWKDPETWHRWIEGLTSCPMHSSDKLQSQVDELLHSFVASEWDAAKLDERIAGLVDQVERIQPLFTRKSRLSEEVEELLAKTQASSAGH